MYLFLYTPIIVLVIFSFNRSPFSYKWSEFSLHWYYKLFESIDLVNAMYNSVVVASASMFLSLLLAVCFVFFKKRGQFSNFLFLFYGGLGVPEVVLAVGLLTLFYLFSVPFGLPTIIAGHTVIGLGYTIPIIQSNFTALDNCFTEASCDLGATHWQTLRFIILPLLRPALLAGGLLVFIVSLDDFVIAFFNASGSTQTLPIYIFSMVRSGATPMINALSTLLIAVTSIGVLIFSLLNVKKTNLL